MASVSQALAAYMKLIGSYAGGLSIDPTVARVGIAFLLSLTLGYKVVELVLSVTMKDLFRKASDLTKKGWIGVFHGPAVMAITISALFSPIILITVAALTLVILPAVVGTQIRLSAEKKKKKAEKKDQEKKTISPIITSEKPEILKKAETKKEEKRKEKREEKQKTEEKKKIDVSKAAAKIVSLMVRTAGAAVSTVKNAMKTAMARREKQEEKKRKEEKREKKAIKLEEIRAETSARTEEGKKTGGWKKRQERERLPGEELIEEIKPEPKGLRINVGIGKKKVEEIKPPKQTPKKEEEKKQEEKKQEEQREMPAAQKTEKEASPQVQELRQVLERIEKRYIKGEMPPEQPAEDREKEEKTEKKIETQKRPDKKKDEQKYDKTLYERLRSAMNRILVEEWKREMERITWRDIRMLRDKADKTLKEIDDDIIAGTQKLDKKAKKEDVEKVALEILKEKGLVKSSTAVKEKRKEERKHRRNKHRRKAEEQPGEATLDLGEEDITSLLEGKGEEGEEEDLLSLLGGEEGEEEEDLEKLLGGE